MQLILTSEYRFYQKPDGSVWTQTAYAYQFWERYLQVFDQVVVATRLLSVAEVPSNSQRTDGESVTFFPLPYYVGPLQYLQNIRKIWQRTSQVAKFNGATILRVPGQIGTNIYHSYKSTKRPFGLEVVGDPHDVFAPGAVDHPLRPIWRWWFAWQLRQQCQDAAALTYVTRQRLQQRYPANPTAFTTYYSDGKIPADKLLDAPRSAKEIARRRAPIRLVFIGSLEQLYKGQKELIRAISICVQTGLDIQLRMIGDGKYRQELESLCQSLGMAERITFVGWIPTGEPIFAELDAADLFVLPSLTEGLPRSMLEAMTRALPCVGTTAGGIPELLAPEDTVPPRSAEALAQKIQEVLASSERMATMSAHNLEMARGFIDSTLNKRRVEFYRYLHDITKEWMTAHS